MANSRRRLIGRVVSDKMDKTVVVAIERRKMHRVYKKVVRTTKKIMAHDESNTVEAGALVQVVESKPISKNKRWIVEKVLETSAGRVLEPIAGDVQVTPETQPAEDDAVEAAPVEDAAAEATAVEDTPVETSGEESAS
jgi:small subunit ribosomal protein S17